MKINKLIHFAFIGALLLISIAIGDNTNNNNNNNYNNFDQNKPIIVNTDCGQWSDTWEDWSECKDGVQSRTKLCHCGEKATVKNENVYKRGLPNDDTDSVEDADSQYTDGKQSSPNVDNSTPQQTGDYSSGDSEKQTGDYSVDHPQDNSSGDSEKQTGDYSEDQPKENVDCKCNGTQPIETRSCPASNKSYCEWSDWGEFSECSKSCGGGVKTRTRQCKCNTTQDYPSGSNDSGYDSSVNTDSGSDNSYTTVKRTDSTEVYTDSTEVKTDDDNNNQCSGLSEETVSCNTQLCENDNDCIWDKSSNSEWSTCKGGVRRRYAICSCDEDQKNNDQTDYSDTSNDYSIQNSDDKKQTPSRCPEPQPYDEEPCYEEPPSDVPSPDTYPEEPTTPDVPSPDCNPTTPDVPSPDTYPVEPTTPDVPSPDTYPVEPTTPDVECKWDEWSEWTMCDKYCNGEQFREQLCTCTGTDSDLSDSYSDNLCQGTPQTETRSCNNTEYGDICSNAWGFLEDEWSPCISENHYCGNGTQWRRQFCLDEDGSVMYDEDCLFTGEVPLFERRECIMDQQCCEFGELVYVKCDSLCLDDKNPSSCVISWAERDCTCGNNKKDEDYNENSTTSDFTQCVWTRSLLENPPIFYDPETDTCPSTTDDKLTECFEYFNETCHSWTVNHKSGEVSSVSDINECDSDDCSNSSPSCWDEWTDWSPCAGTCDEAFQWRRQTSSKGLSACRQPPAYQYRECNLTNCCEWIFDDSIEWNDCSTPCGEGKQIRFPYTCSCDDIYQCPPPEFEFETQDCEFEDSTCPENPIETPETPETPDTPEYPETPDTPETPETEVCEWREDVSECLASCYLSEDSYDNGSENGSENGSDNEYDNGSENGSDNGSNSDNGYDNGSDKDSESGYDDGSENGSDNGSNKVSNNVYDDGSNQGSDNGTDQGPNNGYDNGSENGSDMGSGYDRSEKRSGGYDNGSENGSNKGSNNGYDNGSNKGSNKGSDNGSNKGSNNGYDNKGSNKGSDNGSDQGSNKGYDNGSNKGSKNESDMGSKKGSKKGSKSSPKNCTLGCLTVKMSCYCNGKLSDNSLCPSTQLNLTQNRSCSLNCDRCEWSNHSEWSSCTRGTQYQTRECSCEYRNQTRHKDGSSQKRYSSLCNGYTRISRSCEPLRILSVDDWKNSTWPEANVTKSRHFSSCSNLSWSQLINKTSPNDWEILAAEVIAVHLNILSGAASEDEISEDLKQAEKLLTSCKWSDTQKNNSEELLETLSGFNTQQNSLSLESGNSATNENSASNPNQTNNSIILWIVIPTIVVIVAVATLVVAALIIIKKKRENTDDAVISEL